MIQTQSFLTGVDVISSIILKKKNRKAHLMELLLSRYLPNNSMIDYARGCGCYLVAVVHALTGAETERDRERDTSRTETLASAGLSVRPRSLLSANQEMSVRRRTGVQSTARGPPGVTVGLKWINIKCRYVSKWNASLKRMTAAITTENYYTNYLYWIHFLFPISKQSSLCQDSNSWD